MKLKITDEAVACLKDEWGFEDGERIRVYVRYAGGGGEPYALGITRADPRDDGAAIHSTAGGMTFFMEESDQWFLQERDLTINAEGEEIQFVIEGL